MSFELQQYISQLSLDVQAGRITVDRANELATKARGLADRRGNLGANDRVALRYGVGKSGQRTPTTETGTGDTGTGDGGTGTGDTGTGGTETGTGGTGPVDTGPSPETVATRTNAREYLRGLFKQFGFSEADSQKLMNDVEGWISSGLADAGTDAVLMKFRETTIYQNRFKGMAELVARGQAITEAEYIGLESSFRNVMANYGIDPTYYDSPDDYARLIGAGLSPKEVEERVVAAKQAMNPLVASELKQYYNITDGDLTAYMLGLTNEKGLRLAAERNEAIRTQEGIRTQARAAQIGAAGERAGFNMDKTLAERLGGTSLGQIQDPFQMETLSRLEGTFDQARRVADRETTLAGIDREAFDQRDALAAAFGDRQAQLASERRGKRERARFAGSGGASAGSLAVERNL